MVIDLYTPFQALRPDRAASADPHGLLSRLIVPFEGEP